MLTCRQVADFIASDGMIEAGWLYRALVRLHLFTCGYCQRYASQLRALGKAARLRWGVRPGDTEVLARLEASIFQEVSAT